MIEKKRPSRKRVQEPERLLQFLIVLTGCDDPVWRRIVVPVQYSFWDLHVAIQDAMGWLDCHLHEFVVTEPKRSLSVRVGLPDEEFPEERPTLEGWKVPIEKFFGAYDSRPAAYLYDFGDDWQHVVSCEDHMLAEPGEKYPQCIGGANACPPEDVGGVHGYREFSNRSQTRITPSVSVCLRGSVASSIRATSI